MAKISFTTMGTPEIDGFEAIKMAKKFGFDGVDLRVSDHKGEITPSDSDAKIKELKQAFDNEGIASSGLLCYNEKGDTEESSWGKMQDSLLRHLHIGSVLGCPSIRMFGGDISAHPSEEEFLSKSAQVLQNVLEKYPNMNIVLQNHGNSYTFLQGVKLKQTLNHPNFNMVFSPDHCIMMQEDMQEVYKVAKENSKQLYLSDVKLDESGAVTDRNYRVSKPCLPGQGDVPMLKAYETLGGSEFDGYVTFKWEKIWNDFLPEPEEAFPIFTNMIKSDF